MIPILRHYSPTVLVSSFLSLALFLLLLLGLYANRTIPETALTFSLDGTWAWRSLMNCYAAENTITFTDGQIDVYIHGERELNIPRAKISERLTDKEHTLIVRYQIRGHHNTSHLLEDEYAVRDEDTLEVIASRIDGTSRDTTLKLLRRCPPDSQLDMPA